MAFAQLRATHLAATTAIRLTPEERTELDALFQDRPTGRDPVERIHAWRRRAANPMADPPSVEVFETAARCYERLHAAMAR